MKNFLRYLQQLGIKPNYELWEVFLTRKINFITLIGFFNISLSFILFPIFGIHEFQPLLLVCMILAPFVLIANVKLNYLWGTYGFYVIGLVLMTYFPIKLGMDSYFLFFFFPISFSVVQLLGRKETMIHMIILFSAFLLVAVFVAYSYINGLYALEIEPEVMKKLRAFNIILSAFTALAFIIQITVENQKQEKMIKEMLNEKDVLMAEIFHRVKNNMNIVTSLLNLKKNGSDSADVKEALEECRNRVFSMALVHEKIFKRNDIGGLNLSEYTKDLIIEIQKSLGDSNQNEITLQSIDMDLPLQNAIPCGLILNELITNSYKHARLKDRKLEINIRLTEENHRKKIEIWDNGPGMKDSDFKKNDSLGLELVRSLCDQMNGEFKIENRNGCYFSVRF